MQKGKVLLSVSGFNPQRWHELLAAGREVVLRPEDRERSVDHLCGRLEAAAGHLSWTPKSQGDLFDWRGCRSHPCRQDCARRANRSRRGRESRQAHDRICGLAGDGPSSLRSSSIAFSKSARSGASLCSGPANDVSVGIMGLGNLGQDAARALIALGFRVNGWSRSDKKVAGVTTFSGEAGLRPFLNVTDILVVLLPLTARDARHHRLWVAKELRRRNGLGGAVLDQCRPWAPAEGR